MKSKRAFLVEPGKFEIQEVDVVPQRGEILVKVGSCGLCNWELNHWQGLIGTFPQAIGHEWNGVVVELGENANKFKVGDHVVFCPVGKSFPGFSEYTAAAENMFVSIDNSFKLEDAIGEPLKCIITVLRAAAPEAGDYGVIQGCGPMGLWCVSALKGNLLSGLIAVDIDDEKLAFAKKYGATHTINSAKENAVEKIREISKGHMADFAIEGTGVPILLQTAMTFVRNTGRGRVVLMSSHEQKAPSFDFRIAVAKSLELRVPHPMYTYDTMDDMRRAIEMLENGVFKVGEMISHSFKLEDIQNAFETLEHKPNGFIKGRVVMN